MKKSFQVSSVVKLKTIWHFFVAIAFIFVFADISTAGSDDYGKQPIKLAFYNFGYLYDDGKGIDKDIIDELQKRSGCIFESQVMARARIWADLESGDLDMSVSGIQNPERDKFAWFAHYISVKNYAIVHSTVAVKVKNISDFMAQPQLQMGAVASFKHGRAQDEWLTQLRQAKRVQDSLDAETLFLKLKDHRVDAIFSHPPVYRKYLSSIDMEKTVEIQDWTPWEKGVSAGLILSKHHFNEAQAEKWRSLILDMKKDGTLKKIYTKYVPEAEAVHMLDM